MNIELGLLNDGRVMLVSDEPLPHIISHVEYYRDQRLFMLIYESEGEDNELLMHYEVPLNMSDKVEKSPNMIIYCIFPNKKALGYKVPLIKVGELYPEAA